jgi:hypothetical protein
LSAYIANEPDRRSIADLERFVSPFAPEAPYTLVIDSIRDAYRAFSNRTYVIRREIEIDVYENVRNYSLSVGEDLILTRVLECYYGDMDCKLSPSSTRIHGEGRHLYHMPNPYSISIGIIPAEDKERFLKVQATCKSSEKNMMIDEQVYQEWGEAIGAGAAAYLMGIPNYPFSNESAARRKQMDFERGVRDANVRWDKARHGAPLRMRAPRYV